MIGLCEPNICLINHEEMTFPFAGAREGGYRIQGEKATGEGMGIGDHH